MADYTHKGRKAVPTKKKKKARRMLPFEKYLRKLRGE